MSIIICPNCKSILGQEEKSLKCSQGHSFDISKGGYINLLLANQKKSSNPGDNKTMINARESFLSTGSFDFLIDSIESSILLNGLPINPKDGKIHMLDLGCGSGYYTRHLFKDQEIEKIGLDISKIAIAKAAINDKESTYIVSSIFNAPIEDNAISLLLNIFSPIHIDELKRVLMPDGLFVKVIPKGDHMKEIAALVYDEFRPHTSTIKEEMESFPLLSIVHLENLSKTVVLAKDDVRNFISMTPYLYKFDVEQLNQLKEMEVTISFEIIVGKYQ